MKKQTKILLLVLTLMLLVGALAISAFAATDDASAVTEGLYWKYTDSTDATQYAADFGTAMSGAKAGSTIYLLNDYTITTAAQIAKIDKEITVDLGGHRFEVSQSSSSAVISVATSSQITFKNGAIGACINGNVALSTSNYGRNYGLLNVTWNNSHITLENVDTYIGTLVYSYGAKDFNFTVNGGNHYLLYVGIDWSPSFFCVRGNFTFEANDANFIVSYAGGIISGTTYKAGGNAAARHSTATFNNCYIEHTKTNDGLENASFIRQASNATYFYFNGCYIKGAFNPSFSGSDAYTDETDASLSVTAATSANIVFGEGTRWVESSSNITPSIAPGLVKMAVSEKKTVNFDNAPSTNGTSFNAAANPTLTGYTTANVNRSITCTAMYATPTFRYTSGGVETYSDGTLAEAIAAADEGTTLYMMKPVTVTSTNSSESAVLTISKNLTVDLGGNTLTIVQIGKNYIGVSSGKTVAFQNGTLNAYRTDKANYGHALFRPSSNSTIRLKDVNTYTAGIYMSWNGDAFTFDIDGGEHHSIGADDFWSGYLTTRAGITFTADDAKFYFGAKFFLIDVAAGGSASSAHSYTFNNCEIVGDTVSRSMLYYATEKTEIAFNACKIAASLEAPSLHSTDSSAGYAAIADGAVVLGHGTYIASGATVDGALTSIPDGYTSAGISETIGITMSYATGSMYAGDFSTAESAKSFTFTQKIVSENEVIENADFIVTVDGEESYVDGTLAEAITMANTATSTATIQLLHDAEHTVAAGVSVSRNLTIDLNGKTLHVVQTVDNSCPAFLLNYSSRSFTLTNGTVTVENTQTSVAANVGKCYPIIQVTAANVTVNLTDVTATTAGFLYNNGGANMTVNVSGGSYRITAGVSHSTGSFIETRHNTTVDVTGTSFYLEVGRLVGSLHYKVASGSACSSTFNFTDCDIYRPNVSTDINANANNYTWFNFTGCNIHGSLGGAKRHAFDVSQQTAKDNNVADPTEANIVLGEGTTLASGATFSAVTANDLVLIKDSGSYTFAPAGATYTKSYKISTASSAKFIVNLNGTPLYIDTTFADAITEVQNAGVASSIKLLGNAAYTIPANTQVTISADFTLDLNGFTLDITPGATNQTGLYTGKTGMTFTVKNGTLKVALADGGTNTFPIFNAGAPSTFVFNNVSSYTAGLVYNYGQTGMNVQFIGGEHHIIGDAQNTGGGFVDSRANITVTANGTKFYSDRSRQMFTISSYRTSASAEKSNSFTFTDCYFYNTDASKQIFTMNSYTTVAFNNCVIAASLSPTYNSGFASSGETTAPVANSITLGEGTVMGSGTSVSDAVTLAGGMVNLYYTTATEIAYNTYSAGALSASTVTVTPSYRVGAASAAEYIVTVGGSDVYVPAGYTFVEMIDLVSSGGTIKLLVDVDYTVDTSKTISKGITVDLGGKTLHIIQTASNNCAAFSIKTTSRFTIKNGYLTAESTQVSDAANVGKVYPIIVTESSSTDIVLTDVDITAAGIVHNPAHANMTLTVSGCTYHAIEPVSHTNGTFIESRNNCTVTASDSKFYLESAQLISSLSYKVASGSECNSQFTFNDCEIYRASASSSAIRYMNNYTWIYFTGCKIHASLSGTRHPWDTNQTNAVANNVAEPTAANIVLGEGTSLADGASATATVEDGFYLIYAPTEINFAPAGATYTATSKVGTADNATYRFTMDGVELLADGTVMTLADAIANADAGTTLHLLADISVVTPTDAATTKKAYATINKALILDLGGNTLYFSQSVKQYSVISITTASGVEVKDGTIVYNVNANYTTDKTPAESSSGPLFTLDTNNASLTFTNVNGYGGAIAYSYQATGLTINFNGGEYHVIESNDLLSSVLVETRANTTVNMNGTTVVLDNGASLLNLASYKEGGTRKSTAVITDCTIIGASETANILKHLNNYGTVEFNNCMIYGSINPSAHGTDVDNGGNTQPITNPVAGSVVLGNGTYLAANAILKDGVVVAETDRAIVEASKSYTFSLSFAAGSIYDPANPSFGVETSNEIYTFGLVVGEPPLKNLTVTWYKEDGKTVIIVQTVLEGTVGVTAPTYTPGDNNGWYKTGFDGWTNINGSSEKLDLATYVVTDNVAFYPATKADSTPTAYLSGAEFNLTLTGNITLNFYLPNTPSGVTVLGVYDEDGNKVSYKGVYLPNGQYRRLYVVNTVGATALTTATKLRVVFTVVHNDETIELTQNITLSPYKYAQTILADSDKDTPVYTSATHTLIADMVRYSNVLADTVTGSTVTELDTLLATYGDLCSTLPYDNGFAEYTTSMVDLDGYIKSISFEVSQYQPRWVMNFDASMKITDVKVTLDGYYELPDENGYNFGSLTYELDPDSTVYSGNYVTTAYTTSIPMYNIDRVITITLTVDGGTTVSGTYSLNSYYANVNATGDTLLSVREFLQAFRAFGVTSAGYRYAGGIKQEGKAEYDFFECDHTNVGSWTASRGKYCSDCKTYVFAYADYIANGGKGGQVYSTRDEAYSGKVNSYAAIDYCHNSANTMYQNGYKVGCVAGNNVYYFGEATSYTGTIDEITVITDTDWAGAYFVVDDEPFDITDATYKKAVFGIRSPEIKAPNGTSYSNSGTNITTAIAEALGTADGSVILSPDTTNIGWSCGMPMMVSLIDYSQSRYHREGANASKASSREVILIDEFGNVNPTTPIEWDYVYDTDWYGATPETATNKTPTYVTGSFLATAYPITAAPIKISGLDNSGNISFTFENIANNAVTATSYNGCNRGIMIRGSNITIEGMEHILTEDDTSTTPRQAYAGFVRTSYSHNTVIKDMIVMNHLGHYVKEADNVTDWTNDSGGKNALGSYEFGGDDSIYTSWINCKSTNIFASDGSVTYRGMFGTNRMRNNYLKDCVLNSYDAHSGAYNTTIENSTFEHINFVGQGDIILKNVVIYADSQAGGIHLRQDYGSRWEGNIYIDGLDLRHSTDDYTLKYVDLVKAYYTNWDFGFTDKTSTSGNYLPFEIYANNVTVSSYTRSTQSYTCTNGGIVDENTAVSNLPLGIYVNYDNTLKSEGYNASSDANKQTPTTAIYLTGGTTTSLANLMTPNNAYFANMKIYINGTEQTGWYSTCNGAHSDTDGDMYCNNCTARINCTASHPTSGLTTQTCGTCGATIKKTCLVEGTLITLADGTTKPVEELVEGDEVLSFNHLTGEYEVASIWFNFHEKEDAFDAAITNLVFSNGETLRIAYSHGLFNLTEGKYVEINTENASEYIGHTFLGANGNAELVDAYTTYEKVRVFTPFATNHLNLIAEGMVTAMPIIPIVYETLNIVSYGEDGIIDAEALAADIETYGLYTYDDFAHLITEEEFNNSPFAYLKIAVGKGVITYADIESAIMVLINGGYISAV